MKTLEEEWAEISANLLPAEFADELDLLFKRIFYIGAMASIGILDELRHASYSDDQIQASVNAMVCEAATVAWPDLVTPQ